MTNNPCNATIASPSKSNPTAQIARRRFWWKAFGWALAVAGLGWTEAASGLSVTPVSQGLLASGETISIVLITLDPGDSVPWHFHTGRGWGTLTAGALTEDEGCGNPLNVYAAGSAFAEIPGRVHRVFNFGSVTAVFTWTEIYPACDPNGGTIFVSGPNCEGNSGKSHLEKIPACP